MRTPSMSIEIRIFETLPIEKSGYFLNEDDLIEWMHWDDFFIFRQDAEMRNNECWFIAVPEALQNEPYFSV